MFILCLSDRNAFQFASNYIGTAASFDHESDPESITDPKSRFNHKSSIAV